MKTKYALCIALLMTFLSCQDSFSQKEWKLELFPENNNIPHSAIFFENEIYVLGQKSTKSDTIKHFQSVIKITEDGQILQEKTFGLEKRRMKNIYLSPDKKIYMVGIYENKLWIQEINQNLHIVREKVFENTFYKDLYYPKLLFHKNELVVISNAKEGNVEILRLNSNLAEVRKKSINHPNSTGEASKYISFRDAIITTNQKIVIVGYGSPFGSPEEDEKKYTHDAFFLQEDLENEKTDWFSSVGEGQGKYMATSVVYLENNLYVTGMNRALDESFDIALYKLSREGKVLIHKEIEGKASDWGNDIIVDNGMLTIAGFMGSNSALIRLDDKGQLKDKKIFETDSDDEFRMILKLPADQILILGNSNRLSSKYGNAWNLIKTTTTNMFNQ